MGRDLAQAAVPASALGVIEAALEETQQARTALSLLGSLPWDLVPDVRPTLDAVRIPGSVADGGELYALVPLLEGATRLFAYGRSLGAAAPVVAARLRAFPLQKALGDLLRRSLAEDGGVRDEASPALRRVRARLVELRREVVAQLERHFQRPDAESLFQERYVTIRHGRYVLPVRTDARGRLPGIVHDRSQSGATLFVEPQSAVEGNNELVQAAREEEAEVLRVLAALTDAVRMALPDLVRLVEDMGDLDLVFARAELAERMEAVKPGVGAERQVAVRAARNPLLLAQSWKEPGRIVVPVDLDLDGERPLLVITGPNAGGKTVALKTLGLLSLMAQAGCHVPAREGARLPVFTQVFAIVGDEQSVAENLSTFSAFVKQLKEVLEHVDGTSLVLLDELGAGTDPDDGAALAQAVLEELAERGALCVASTHLEPLKAFASTYARARNASVEFDAERLAPTFRLVYDRPGQSYALAIGARLGLSPDLIARADRHRTAHQRQLQDLLARLDERDRRDAERAAAIARREAESAALRERARAELAAAERTARETVDRARTESRRLVGEVRRAVNEEWERLRQGERTRADLDKSRRRLGEIAQAGRDAAEASPRAVADRLAEAGDPVEVAHLGLRGRVLAIEGGTATVQAGTVTVKVPREALQITGVPSAPPTGAPASAGPARRPARAITVPERSGVAPELHLIGRTTDEARDLLEKYLDDAFLAGLGTVRIIHGKGTGALRRAVADVLALHPLVAEHRPGAPDEGGAGATVAVLGQA
jgi:DNA mismatch repair protein MutS2